MNTYFRSTRAAAFVLVAGLVLQSTCAADEQPPQILLWPNGAPAAQGNTDDDKPGLWLYRPSADKANGTAVVICPGGGYHHLAVDHEGHDVARWFNDLGVTAFVLRYRLGPRYRHPTQIGDAQRAIRLVRARAAEWDVDPQRIGIMGFSAGGHLASTVATHFDDGNPSADEPLDRCSSRPDFVILAYPVITLDGEFAHAGSRKSLLGDKPAPELLASLCNQNQVTPQTPPTFLFHTSDDKTVAAENSAIYYMALRRAKVPAEMHIYESGRHGVGLARDNPALSSWTDLLAAWLDRHELLKKKT